MDKVELKNMLNEGLSYRKIAKKCDCSPKKVEYWVNKHQLKKNSAFNVEYRKDVDHKFFNKIDSIEKAYILGFLLGDGYISDRYDVEIGVTLKDQQIVKDIAKFLPWAINIMYINKLNKKTRVFPKARFIFRSRGIGKDLVKHFSDRLASKRHTPRIAKKYELYLLAGFFDADGCVTWGYRKDRNVLRHKVNFTAALSILTGIQNILLSHDIASKLRPKSGEDCYVLEFTKRSSILKLHEILPQDGIRLQRKVDKYNALIDKLNSPLRHESDENGGNS